MLKKIFGIIFILLGIINIQKVTITGFAISNSIQFRFIWSLLFFFIGIFLMIQKRNLETLTRTREFEMGTGISVPQEIRPEELETYSRDYANFLKNQQYLKFHLFTGEPVKFTESYKHDRAEYEEIGKESQAKQQDYIKKRFLEMINSDTKRFNEFSKIFRVRIPRVMTSKQARNARKKDKTISDNLGEYISEIRKIVINPEKREAETIGEFLVSPRGGKRIRIAWEYDPESNTIKIHDLLYHVSMDEYNGKWNRKATKGEITKKTYTDFRDWNGSNELI